VGLTGPIFAPGIFVYRKAARKKIGFNLSTIVDSKWGNSSTSLDGEAIV
jgi:hypothetical protein